MKWIRRRLGAVSAAVLVAMMIPAAVMAAGGTFVDDDDSIFESNIEWLAGAGVTLGCNPPANDNFCPDDNVSRGQMAAFMQRFAQYLGAEDGTVAEADHATTADTAGNATSFAGRNRYQYQPALFAFEFEDDVDIVADGTVDVVSAEVTTSTATFCQVGQSPQADILVRASGRTNGITAGEAASVRLNWNGDTEDNTRRVVEEHDGSYAMEWLFVTDGGTETFALESLEATGDTYSLWDTQITVEVLQDTRCEGGAIIVIPTLPNEVDSEAPGN